MKEMLTRKQTLDKHRHDPVRTGTMNRNGSAHPNHVRIELRLTLPAAAALRKKRGDIPAATYIRRLIERDLKLKGDR